MRERGSSAGSDSLADWLTRIESWSPSEIVLGLERVREVLGRLQPRLPQTVLTIGGTNGKGSSVELAQSLCASAGYVTGAYTSPHISDYNERIRVNGEAVDDATIVAAFEIVDRARGDVPLTYFEFGTLAALQVFAARAVDVAVLEVGMGGRLDAVNAIEPTASLITNVSMDHMAWLGNDVEAIGTEKAGILRPGKPGIFASPEVPESVRRVAAELGADLRVAGKDFGAERDGDGWRWWGRGHRLDGLVAPALPGPAQYANAAGVLALLESAGLLDLLERDRVNAALRALRLPGRMQRVTDTHHWLLDVAHNPAAAGVLAAALRETDHRAPTVMVVGMLDDKDVEDVVGPLAPLADRWIAMTADSHRALPAEELARRIANATGRACLEASTLEEALEAARAVAGRAGRIVVTGSFYTVGPVLRALSLYSPPQGQANDG